jgi:hypothetical protein
MKKILNFTIKVKSILLTKNNFEKENKIFKLMMSFPSGLDFLHLILSINVYRRRALLVWEIV